MCEVNKKTETHLSEMIEELNLQETELKRIETEKKLRNRLLEMQAIYDTKKDAREKARKKYNDSKLTMSVLIEKAESFCRPTLYGDPLLRQYAELLVTKCNEDDASEKAQRALAERQEVERYNEALVRDILELMHSQEECSRLKEQVARQAQKIAELEDKLGVKSNVLPMERRVVTKPNNLDGVFPVDLHRD